MLRRGSPKTCLLSADNADQWLCTRSILLSAVDMRRHDTKLSRSLFCHVGSPLPQTWSICPLQPQTVADSCRQRQTWAFAAKRHFLYRIRLRIPGSHLPASTSVLLLEAQSTFCTRETLSLDLVVGKNAKLGPLTIY